MQTIIIKCESLQDSSVVETARLADGTLFPMPINIDVSQEDIDRLKIIPGTRLALRDPRDDEALAILTGKLYQIFFMN